MSFIEVKVPELSESVSEATVLEWKKKPGESIKLDEVLVEIETDKIVLEVPAPNDGVLSAILSPEDSVVVSGQVIATIDTEAQASADVATEPAPAVQGLQTSSITQPTTSVQPGSARSEILMPAAAKLVVNAGLSTEGIVGTGLDGRILKQDILQAQMQPAQPAPVKAAALAPKPVKADPAPVPADSMGRLEQRVPMSRLRARVAERLLQSQQQAAILTTFNEVNLGPVIELRKKYKEAFEKKYHIKLGFMSFFVKAVCAALKEFPIINASVDGNDIIYHSYFDIGIAVGSPRGLVVPILRNADQLSFAEIEKQIADFGQRAKDGKLTIDELTGGTFTISNGGVFGSLMSTPIINPPQSAILGIHATKERPVVENGQIVIRPMNYFALSYDHRIIDGREAVLALVAIKNALEDPARLLLEI